MPFKKQPSTLNTLCLKIVTTNIDLFKDTMSELPNTLIDQLLAQLPDFIHPRTQTLEIDCRMPGVQDLVTKVIDTCKMLKELILRESTMYRSNRETSPYSSMRDPDTADCSSTICDLTQLIRNVPKLEDLTLLGTCTDDLLLEIGQHCPNLLNLHIEGSHKKVETNRGILDLCIDGSTGKSRNLALRCLSILTLPSHQVTVEACYMALRNLPHLTKFDHCFWNELLSILESEKAIRTYPSIKWCTELTPNQLAIAISIFPNIDDISVDNYYHESFIYVLPVISDVMESLTGLCLYKVVNLDISTVASRCPKLQSLSLEYSSTKTNYEKMKKSFEELRNLQLMCLDTTEKVLLDVLVNSPGLTSLKMYQYPLLGDSLVADLCGCNALSHMQRLFISCNEREMVMSLDGFKQILSMKNPLKSVILDIWDVDYLICTNDLEKFITFNNLDVDFVY